MSLTRHNLDNFAELTQASSGCIRVNSTWPPRDKHCQDDPSVHCNDANVPQKVTRAFNERYQCFARNDTLTGIDSHRCARNLNTSRNSSHQERVTGHAFTITYYLRPSPSLQVSGTTTKIPTTAHYSSPAYSSSSESDKYDVYGCLQGSPEFADVGYVRVIKSYSRYHVDRPLHESSV